jgi:hypothetical protein
MSEIALFRRGLFSRKGAKNAKVGEIRIIFLCVLARERFFGSYN